MVRFELFVCWVLVSSVVGWPPVVAETGDGDLRGSKRIEEIVVTATRRTENLQDVSMAVSAFSGDALAARQINSLDDLSGMVPGLVMNQDTGAAGVNPQLRGAFVSEDSPAVEMPIAIFVDGVYNGSAAAMQADLYDLDTVEVLRGPQGTTFGRNVTGGVIRLRGHRPELGADNARISVTAADLPGIRSDGYVNRGFGGTMAGRLSYSFARYDGHRRNTVTGSDLGEVDRRGVRGQLRFEPRADLDVLLSTSYSKDESQGIARKAIPVLRSTDRAFSTTMDLLPQVAPTLDEVELDEDGFIDRESYQGILEVTWQTERGTLTSTTTARRFDVLQRFDVEAASAPMLPRKDDEAEETQYSQEIRFVSPSGERFEWIAGLYLLHQELDRQENNHLRSYPGTLLFALDEGYDTITYQDVEVKSWAPYAELTWNITEMFSAFAGVRYTHDEKTGTTQHLGDANVITGDTYAADLDASFDATTPRVGIEIRPSDDVMLYATASRGFKSGGFTNNATTQAAAETPFNEEFVWSYEVGARTAWLEDRVRANLTGFWADTKDLQTLAWNGFFFTFFNAAESRQRGVEVELTALPTERLQLDLTYGYLDAKYLDFPGCGAGVNCRGNRIPQTPEHSLYVAAEYSVPAPALGGTLSLRGEYSYRSEIYLDPRNSLTASRRLSEQNLVNAFLAYESSDLQWQVSLWGRNLFDDRYVIAANDFGVFYLSPAELGAGKTVHAVTPSGHRSVGATVSRRF